MLQLSATWQEFTDPRSNKNLIDFSQQICWLMIYCYPADAVAKYEEEKEKLFARYEQLSKQWELRLLSSLISNSWNKTFAKYVGKKEKTMITDLEKACAGRIADLEESLKKKKQVSAS